MHPCYIKKRSVSHTSVMQSYHELIGNVKYDRAMLEAAREGVGKGGKITKKGVVRMMYRIDDANVFTDGEKVTLEYIMDNYRFTEAASAAFAEKAGVFITELIEATNSDKKKASDKKKKASAKKKKALANQKVHATRSRGPVPSSS